MALLEQMCFVASLPDEVRLMEIAAMEATLNRLVILDNE
jgi:hypothetical protein